LLEGHRAGIRLERLDDDPEFLGFLRTGSANRDVQFISKHAIANFMA
jgi:hypothetical protein